MPQYLWLATRGKSQFNSRLAVLKGRKIIAFPDIDAYHDWLIEFLEGKNNLLCNRPSGQLFFLILRTRSQNQIL